MAITLHGTGSSPGNSYTVTLSVPSGAVVGDLMLAFISCEMLNQSSTIQAPAGWTKLDEVAAQGGSWRLSTWSRVYQSGDTSWSWSYSSNGAIPLPSAILAYGGASSVDGHAATNAGGSSTDMSPAVTATSASDVLICAYTTSYGSTPPTYTVPPGMTEEVFVAAASAPPALLVCDQHLTQSGPTGDATVTWYGANGAFTSASITLLPTATAPSAPTLTAPAAGATLDVSAGVSLSATYNSTDGAAQNAYALRIKTSGAGSYQYWNAGSGTLQSTIVWNTISTAPGASWTVSLPSAAVANGNTYNWSMASQEAQSNLQGVFASDQTFIAQAPPSVVVTGPSGTFSGTAAAAAWTTTPGSPASQTAYRVVLYTAVQYSISGFTPGTSPSTWDSGTVTSSAQSAAIGATLANGMSYRVYVQVTETGGETSSWQYSAFTVSFDSPATPKITATAGTDSAGCPTVTLVVTGMDNLLSADDASFEGSVGTWVAVTNASVARSANWAVDGSYSLGVTATAAGNASAQNGAVAIVAGGIYTGWAVVRAAATARSVQLQVVWLDGTGTPVGTAASVTVTDSTGANTVLSVTGTAPVGATQARLLATVTAAVASEVHYLDECGLLPGTATAWTRGGLVGATTAQVTYPDPDTGAAVPVRAVGASGVSLPGPGQQVTVVDTEVIPGVARTYSATVVATV